MNTVSTIYIVLFILLFFSLFFLKKYLQVTPLSKLMIKYEQTSLFLLGRCNALAADANQNNYNR